MLNPSHAIIEGYLEGPLYSMCERPLKIYILTLKLNPIIHSMS